MSENEKKLYECDICGNVLTNQNSLIRHHNNCHTNDKLREIYSCQECPKKFKLKANLISHLQRSHGPGTLPKIPETKCTLCEKRGMRDLILDHYQKDHDIEFEYQDVKFNSKDEFFDWKKEVERVDNCVFVKNRGEYMTKGGMLKLSFKCFRDGKNKEPTSRQKRMKLIGSNKIGCCPARIDFSSRKNDIRVKFCRTHVHYKDPSRMRLTEEEKDMLAHKIASNISTDDILKEARTYPDNGRLFYLKRKDLFNIARQRGLQIRKKRPTCEISRNEEKKTEKEESKDWTSDEEPEYYEVELRFDNEESVDGTDDTEEIDETVVDDTEEIVDETVDDTKVVQTDVSLSLEQRKSVLYEQWKDLIYNVDSHHKLDVLSDYYELFYKSFVKN